MRTKRVKYIVDVLLGIGLVLLMAYQVVGEEGHEWTGIAMTALMLIHQVLNRKWYAALFKGKYGLLRTVQTVINLALLGCFLLTALSGINMGVYAVPSLAEFMKASTGRRMHLALSHWSFILMGLHLGPHMPAMLRSVKSKIVRRIGYCLSVPAAGAGLYFFLKNSFPDYLSFQRHFAFIDYEKPIPLVLAESLLIVFFFAFLGFQLQQLLARSKKGKEPAVLGIALAVAIGIAMNAVFPAPAGDSWSGEETPWGGEAAFTGAGEPDDTEVPKQEESEEIAVDDGFVLISGGSFLMGSPESVSPPTHPQMS